MDGDSGLTAQLAPLEAAMLAAARAQADARVKEAQTEADRTVADGTAKARGVIAAATAEGERAAARAAAHRLVDGKRRARSLVLSAQNEAYRRLVVDSIAAAEGLRDRPEYTDLERRLVDLAKATLGPDATIEVDPDDWGGVRAVSRGRTLDLTLAALARLCVDHLGQGATRLWE